MNRLQNRRGQVTAALALGITLVGLRLSIRPAEACRSVDRSGAFSMEILVDGRPLSEYAARGTTYVEALKGREYAVRLTNGSGERVAVALAVDGLNSIDAAHTTPQEARKWILAPWETVTLAGWQTGTETARRFVFTSEARSYGAWLGRTTDLGVISAAFFREARRPDRVAAAPWLAPPSAAEDRASNQAKAAVPEPRALDSRSGAARDELAATGIGRQVEHRVEQVDFDAEASPSATVAVRYEFHDALVRLGVIPATIDPLARREHARGFAEPGFAPDPYRGR